MAEGLFAYGVLAQSIGGGGGVGGMNISAGITGAGNAAKKSEGILIVAGVGGNGGVGANAGDVTLNSDGNVFVNTLVGLTPEGEVTFAASTARDSRRAWLRNRSVAAVVPVA